eukprot:Colp12_sorted_trinity150504_noHs@16835
MGKARPPIPPRADLAETALVPPPVPARSDLIPPIPPRPIRNITAESYPLSPISPRKVDGIDRIKALKCFVVGDGAVGKSSLITSYITQKLPNMYVPTVFDSYSVGFLLNGVEKTLIICDTPGQEDFDTFRNQVVQITCGPSDTHTVVFLVVFSLVQPASLHNVEHRWVPYLRRTHAHAPFLLVGTMADRRQDPALSTALKPYLIATETGRRLAKKLGAVGYVECSAAQNWNVKDVFDAAITACVCRVQGGETDGGTSCWPWMCRFRR